MATTYEQTINKHVPHIDYQLWVAIACLSIITISIGVTLFHYTCIRDRLWIYEEAREVFIGSDEISDEMIRNEMDRIDPGYDVIERLNPTESSSEANEPDRALASEELEMVFTSKGQTIRQRRKQVFVSPQTAPHEFTRCENLPAATDVEKVVEKDMTPIKNYAHRRLPHRKTTSYITCVVAELKVKFGVPLDTAANRLAVRRSAADICKKHGLRPTHIMRVLDKCVAYTFMPCAFELEARMVENSRTVTAFKADYHRASPNRWGQWNALNAFFGRREEGW